MNTFFALGRRKIVPNILVDFALACLWGRGFWWNKFGGVRG